MRGKITQLVLLCYGVCMSIGEHVHGYMAVLSATTKNCGEPGMPKVSTCSRIQVLFHDLGIVQQRLERDFLHPCVHSARHINQPHYLYQRSANALAQQRVAVVKVVEPQNGPKHVTLSPIVVLGFCYSTLHISDLLNRRSFLQVRPSVK
jgi:hypothetical protein